jgi:hypothetical protein
MRTLFDVAKRVFPAAFVIAAVLASMDIAGVHGMAPFRPRPLEDIYWRFPIYLVGCWLFFVISAFIKSARDSS